MFTHFQTELRNVKKDGVVLTDATIVTTLATVQTDGNIPIPEKYLGCDILGKLWDYEAQEFYQVEEIQEETQLDRIENNTTTMLEETSFQTTALNILAGTEV